MLATYAGREGGLLKNLRKMKSKEDEDAAMKAKIEALFEELDLSSNKVDEMLAEYVGREEKLLANLKKLEFNLSTNFGVTNCE
jgi:predicted DNA-binding antitoxin AbrB/MazE fold protein